MDKMWLRFVVLQIVLLCSIHVIYFQSTVITGLPPQTPSAARGLPAPADRLVVFLTDGLRAMSFFEQRCNNVPHLRKIFLHQGIVGISRTRAPTESRPAHVAIFAGFFEDPASVTRGWARNAVQFDTLFNRSLRSYAWGSDGLLQHFAHSSKMHIQAHHNDVGGKAGKVATYKLDEWVFNSVRDFLKLKGEHLQHFNGIVFFLHLVGLDEAFHKSDSAREFYENLNYTQRGVWQLYQSFEQTFPDARTVYLLTSDHGMTDAGGHGGDSKEEVETPLLLWGAGIANDLPDLGRAFVPDDEDRQLPLQIVQQTQLTPLMSALLGLPPPVNNRGILPAYFLNASARYKAYALHSNALQLFAQGRQLLQRHQRGMFTALLPNYRLGADYLQNYVKLSDKLWRQGRFLNLQHLSLQFMPVVLEYIDYYRDYYIQPLLMATAVSFLGWLYLLHCQLGSASEPGHNDHLLLPLFARALCGLLLSILLLQRVPWLVAIYLLLPLIVWLLAMRERVRRTERFCCRQLFWPVGCAILFVGTFFQRALISVCYLVFACCSNRRAFRQREPEFYLWLLLVFGLSAMPWLPPSMGCSHKPLLIASLLLTFLRPLACGTVHGLRTQLLNGAILLATIVNVYQNPLPRLMHLASWAYLIYVFYAMLRQRFALLKPRIELIFFNLSTLYTLLCTAQEALVIQLLAMELQLSLRLRLDSGAANPNQRSVAIYMLLYTLYSFFAISDVPAVDSFRTYLDFCAFGYSSIFTNTLVIALKLFLPILLLLCIVCGNCEGVWAQRRQIFTWLLFMCNVMALVFLFLVKNRGSWTVIGVSIVHFVTVQALPFIMLLLWYIAELLLHTKQLVELPK